MTFTWDGSEGSFSTQAEAKAAFLDALKKVGQKAVVIVFDRPLLLLCLLLCAGSATEFAPAAVAPFACLDALKKVGGGPWLPQHVQALLGLLTCRRCC